MDCSVEFLLNPKGYIMNLTTQQIATLATLNAVFGNAVTRQQLLDYYKKEKKNGILPRWLMADKNFNVKRGVYSTMVVGDVVVKNESTKDSVGQEKVKTDKVRKSKKIKSLVSAADLSPQSVVPFRKEDTIGSMSAGIKPTITIGGDPVESLIPEPFKAFVPFGAYFELFSLIESNIFFPVYVVGLSGNGKTMMIEQACAEAKREMIRVQITPETDEDDLIGGFRLINGETVWFDGPVTVAAKRGAVCLIDEIDYGTGKISCLQGILEGKGIFLKKINRLVKIEPGFNIIATANTKGRGSEEGGGRFMNTNIMNEAFLERFGMMYEQSYPESSVEEKILNKEFSNMVVTPPSNFVSDLVKWAQITRNTFDSGAVDDLITTRRLVHIVRAFAVLGGNEELAIKRCISRFDSQIKESFYQLWEKVRGAPPAAGDNNTTSVVVEQHENVVV